MRALVVLLTVVASSVAEPPLFFRHDLPHFHDHRYEFGNPHVHELGHPFPHVHELGHPFPHVHGFDHPFPHTHALPIVRHEIPPIPISSPYYAGLKSQYYDRGLLGEASYGHTEPGHTHYAVQDARGNKIGGFSYYNADGKLVQTSYIADAAGYRVSSNDLPEDTPEVKAAKAAHLAEHEKAKSRIRRDVLAPASVTPFSHLDYRFAAPVTRGFPFTSTVPVVKPDGYLADTPEVAAAKARHFAEVEATKTRAFHTTFPGTQHFDYRFSTPF